jgi:putative oxidoreductase
MADSSGSRARRSAPRSSWLDPLGRLLLCLVFVQAVLSKVTGFEAVATMIEGRGLPLAAVLLAAAMALMAAGSILVISGLRPRLGALLLLAFLVPTTLLFHSELADPQQRIQLFKNLAIMGGLLLVVDRSPSR